MSKHSFTTWMRLPNWPPALWMVVVTLALGLVGGVGAAEMVELFNAGFGRTLGEFMLILLPSFILASALERRRVTAASGIAAAVSPLAGAGMICPDTAYAALSPAAGARRLDLAFGAYAGFKLLYPAGPLIVATGLGIRDDSLFLYGLVLLLPVWAVGVLWGRMRSGADRLEPQAPTAAHAVSPRALLTAFGPFLLLALLLVLGWTFDSSGIVLVDFITQPKGALMAAAALALIGVPAPSRRECLDAAVRRTSSLLLVLGAASAFGSVLMQRIMPEALVPAGAGLAGLVGLFALTALFKLAQGSSMATFAAVTPVAAPMVMAMELPPAAAVFAICAGSFVTILPNDSFYWLVRKDALAQDSEPRSLATLAGGALLQAFTGLGLILAAVSVGVG